MCELVVTKLNFKMNFTYFQLSDFFSFFHLFCFALICCLTKCNIEYRVVKRHAVCIPALTDVNECEANPCSQECANVYGSYQCYCRRGYQLSDIDGITCEGTGFLWRSLEEYRFIMQPNSLEMISLRQFRSINM